MEISQDMRMTLSRFAKTICPSQREIEGFLTQFPDETLFSYLETSTDTTLVDDILAALELLCCSSSQRLKLWSSEHIIQIMQVACRSSYPPARAFLAKRLCDDFPTLPNSLQHKLKPCVVPVACCLIFESESAALEPAVDFIISILLSKCITLAELLAALRQSIEQTTANVFKQQCVVALRLASISPEHLKAVESSGLLNIIPEFILLSNERQDILLNLVVYELLCEFIQFPEAVAWLHESKILEHIWTCLCEETDPESSLNLSRAQLIERAIEYSNTDLIPMSKVQHLFDVYVTNILLRHSGNETDTMGALGLFSSLLFSGRFDGLEGHLEILSSVVDMAVNPRVASPLRNAALKSLENGLKCEKNNKKLKTLYVDHVVVEIVNICKKPECLVDSRIHLYSLLSRVLICFPSVLELYQNDIQLREVLNLQSSDLKVAEARLQLKRIFQSHKNNKDSDYKQEWRSRCAEFPLRESSSSFQYVESSMGKVHGSLARAGKVKNQTPKVSKQEKRKAFTGRAKKRMQYNRRFVSTVFRRGRKGPNSQTV